MVPPDPIEMGHAQSVPGLQQMIMQLVEENADLDSVRVICTKATGATGVMLIQGIYGNRLLADKALEELNAREVQKYDDLLEENSEDED